MEKLNRRRLTTEEFVSRALDLYGEKYSYHKSEVQSAASTVLVTCPTHGDFSVVARRHINKTVKQGCPACTNYLRLDLKEFISRAIKRHGSKYDYSKVDYVGSAKKVIIVCPEHGEFMVTPSLHYGPRAVGCTVCSGKSKLTTEDFISKSREIHGSKYLYDKTLYTASNNKLTITCPEHGDFNLRASAHIGKSPVGCVKCKGRSLVRVSRMDTERFIQESRKTHGDKYDYSESEYISAKQKLTVRCSEHGPFTIRPSAHYGKQKQGCPACGGRPKIDTAIFIESSKKIFRERFNYNKTVYKNATSKVVITCKEHGDFQVLPGNHLNGNGGCRVCSGRPDVSTKELVERLQLQFGEMIDYSKVDYRGQNRPITLVCPFHGEFKALPSAMLRKTGCPACIEYTVEDFIKKAAIVHGNKYDYSKVNYINGLTPVKIICPKHGVFQQKPSVHLSNRGCQICGVESNIISNKDPNSPCILYYLTLTYKGHKFWKIGITTKSIDIRYKNLHKDNVSIEKALSIETTIQNAIVAEARIISENEESLEYRGHILKNAKGGTECFSKDVIGLSGLELREYLT